MSQTLRYFQEITRYPRPSKREEKIRNFLISWAESRKYRYAVDAIGNLIVYVDAKNTPSKETVILQSHLDMVCVKTSESTHDFDTDGIETYEENGFLRAKGTSLGADNGIGMALSMAACDFTSHPAFELLFTVDEEMGMSGVENLDFSLLSGKKIINLDSEDEDEICISSAGGIGITATKKLEFSKRPAKAFAFSIFGMIGGHSGCEIHENRGNALTFLLDFLSQCPFVAEVCDVRWGTACNVIPSEARAVIEITDESALKREAEAFISKMKREFHCPDIAYSLEAVGDSPLAIASWRNLFKEIGTVKSGVHAMSKKIPGLVETSMNFGIFEMENGNLKLTYLLRSSVNDDLRRLADETEGHFQKCAYAVERDRGYLGWQDDPNSALLRIAQEEMEKILGKPPRVTAIHAGLECGTIVSGLWKSVNAISIGPNVFEVHGVNERLEIASVEKTERILEGILKRL